MMRLLTKLLLFVVALLVTVGGATMAFNYTQDKAWLVTAAAALVALGLLAVQVTVIRLCNVVSRQNQPSQTKSTNNPTETNDRP